MKKLTLLLFLCFATLNFVSYGQFAKLYDFQAENDLFYSGYSQPVFDGIWLYDVSSNGGVNGMGCIYKIKPDGTNYTKIIDFNGTSNGKNPYGALVLFDSNLYGMTYGGGANNLGTIFKVSIDGTAYSKLLDFAGTTNGSNPYGSLTLSGEVLYGMTYGGGANNLGTIFKINIDGNGYTKLLDFAGTTNGSNPKGSLTLEGTVLYGMTYGGGTNNFGTTFKISSNGSGYTKLLDFTGTVNGKNPYGSLTLSGTVLYGMTYAGGANNWGTIYKCNIDGTGYNKLLDFNWTNGGCITGSLTISGSILYGMTNQGGTNTSGTIFKIGTDGTGFTKLLDFAGTSYGTYPRGSLTLSGSSLFGTSNTGGISNKGVLFKINTDGSAFTKILEFNKALSGCNPYGSLTISGSVMYGMTANGGNKGNGTIFKINSDGTGYSKLLDFEGATNGRNPYGSLTLAGSVLYGMTCRGGANDKGTIFKINLDGTGYSKLLDFAGTTNGSNPYGALIISGSVLYGLTYSGGTYSWGTIFKINTNGTGYLKLLDFKGIINGGNPNGALILYDSFLYGMTCYGGANDDGTIFKINIDGTGFTKLLDLKGVDSGGGPLGSLIRSDSLLYGMTFWGGKNNIGTILEIKIDGTKFKKLLDFDYNTNGAYPQGSLTLSDSILYGMTSEGGANSIGTVFKIKTDGSEFTNIQDFNGIKGRRPYYTDLILDSNTFYGMTQSGGTMQAGVIFKYDIPKPCIIPTIPTLGQITQPTCAIAKGEVILDGLPSTGTWTITRLPGEITSTGIGTSTTISDLVAGSYSFTVTIDTGCKSEATANVVINEQPNTPSAPVVGLITQPTINLATGSVVLNALPESGIWILTRTPGEITTTGTGTSIIISDLAVGTYAYNVTNESGCTSVESDNIVINTLTTGIDENKSHMINYLGQNHPNPFDQSTTIDFNLVKPSFVKLTVFNNLGKEVDVIVNEYLQVGSHSKQWNPKGIPAGIYFYQLNNDGIKLTKRLVKK